MSKRDELLLLQDIYEAGTKIQKYVTGYSFQDFLNDERTIDAVIRNFEVMGEACRRVSEDSKLQYAEIDWRKMMNFRNLLIHEYFGINYEIVWSVIEDYLPKNIGAIERLISSSLK